MPAPRPPRRPTTRTRHGRTDVDDYAWLLDLDRADPDVLDHLRAENVHTDEVLAHTTGLQDDLFAEIRGRVRETDLSVPTHRRGYWYYSRQIEGAQYPVHCRVPAGDTEDPPDPDAPATRAAEEVLLDQNREAGDDDYFALGVFDLDPSGTVLAWAADRDGSETYTLRFRDLAGPNAGTDRDDVVEGVYYSSAWSADGAHLFYTRPDHAMRPAEVWRHALGRPAAEDVLVHREDDERFFCSVGPSTDERFVLIDIGSKTTDEILAVPADDAARAAEVVVARRDGVQVTLDHVGDAWWALTNDDAVDFRVLRTAEIASGGDATATAWEEVVPHRPGVRVEDVSWVAGHLVVEARHDASTTVTVLDPATGATTELPRPEEVSTLGALANDDPDWPFLRYRYTSLVTPTTVVDRDLRTGVDHVRKVQPVEGGYRPEDYVSERRWAVADDGTRVPISVVHRRDRQGPGPTLLYGYGAYEISIDPGFSSARLSLLDRGWAFAIAHVRGGGEMGRRWYDEGRLAAKANSFDDLIAAGRHLVAEGIAAPDGLAVRGGSAGGLLVGAALNRAPELWSAVVAEVPFVDALNTILDPSLPLTVTEWEEWGNPVEDPSTFARMRDYTPYENVPPVALPPVLATAGLHDPRVGYWEPAKWVARLRDVADGVGCGGPFLLRTEMGAGHGGPSGRYDAWRDEALVFAFLIDAIG